MVLPIIAVPYTSDELDQWVDAEDHIHEVTRVALAFHTPSDAIAFSTHLDYHIRMGNTPQEALEACKEDFGL